MKYRIPDPAPDFVREPEPVGAYDAKTRLPELLSYVEAGRSYVITRHGRPIARLVPVEPPAEAERVAEALLASRKGRRLGVPLRELVEAGRR